MLSSTVEMSVPKIKVVDVAKLADYIGEEPAALVIFELQGEFPHGGYIIVYISRKSAVRMTNTMLGLTDQNRPLNEMDESALIEIGNIMASAFLDATAELLGFVMLPSPPTLIIDMAHAAMQSLIAQMQEEIDEVMLFSTELVCEEHKIDSDIIMMPEVTMLKTFVERLENLMKSS
jgi:chemotaxis protein CheC